MIELTMPWERIEATYKRKANKKQMTIRMQDRMMEGRWAPKEIGCRDFIDRSVWTKWKILRITSNNRTKISKHIDKRGNAYGWSKTTWIGYHHNRASTLQKAGTSYSYRPASWNVWLLKGQTTDGTVSGKPQKNTECVERIVKRSSARSN